MSCTGFQAKLNTPPNTVHDFPQRVLWNSCRFSSNVVLQILGSIIKFIANKVQVVPQCCGIGQSCRSVPSVSLSVKQWVSAIGHALGPLFVCLSVKLWVSAVVEIMGLVSGKLWVCCGSCCRSIRGFVLSVMPWVVL
jgi:hypothetical protein